MRDKYENGKAYNIDKGSQIIAREIVNGRKKNERTFLFFLTLVMVIEGS